MLILLIREYICFILSKNDLSKESNDFFILYILVIIVI